MTSKTYDRGGQSSARRLAGGDYHAALDVVREHPNYSALTVFGLGLAIGACLGAMLADASERAHRERMGTAERIGRKVLEGLSDMLPESLTR